MEGFARSYQEARYQPLPAMKPLTLHPPLAEGEKFLGNLSGNTLPAHLAGIVGLRLALPAYDITGEKIPGHSALVADQSGTAQYNQIQEARLSAIRRGR